MLNPFLKPRELDIEISIDSRFDRQDYFAKQARISRINFLTFGAIFNDRLDFYGAPGGIRTPNTCSEGKRDIRFTTGA